MLGNTDVVVEYQSTSCTCRQCMLRPAHDPHSCIVTEHASELRPFFHVPDLNFTCPQANTNIRSIPAPFDTAHVRVRRGLQEAADCTRFGRPYVDVPLQTNRNLVTRAPVEKIEVVIVNEARGIKDPLWGSLNSSTEL